MTVWLFCNDKGNATIAKPKLPIGGDVVPQKSSKHDA